MKGRLCVRNPQVTDNQFTVPTHSMFRISRCFKSNTKPFFPAFTPPMRVAVLLQYRCKSFDFRDYLKGGSMSGSVKRSNVRQQLSRRGLARKNNGDKTMRRKSAIFEEKIPRNEPISGRQERIPDPTRSVRSYSLWRV